MQEESSEQVFDLKENQIRQRKYVLNKYEEEMYEYVTEGNAAEKEKMKAAGREFVRSRSFIRINTYA